MTDLLSEMLARYMVPQTALIETATEIVFRKFSIGSASDLKARFDDLLVEIEIETYRLYLEKEKQLVLETVRELILRPLKGPGPYSREEVSRIAEDAVSHLASLFMHLGQSRRSKAGKTFEWNLRSLFRRLDYPFDEQKVIDGKPDFLMPGEELFKANPAEVIILTAKRTLRERWRQITTEGKHFRLFLATIDEGISQNQLAEMLKQQVHLVVPQKLINRNSTYKDAINVVSFSEFFRDFVDPAVTRWRAKGWVW